MRLAALAIALLLIGTGAAAQSPPDRSSSAGMGELGAAVQAGNRDCPPRGAPGREISVPSAPGAESCAPTGAGPPIGQAPTPSALAHPLDKGSPNTRETPGRPGQ
jgi:hypothetical protein